MGKYDTCMQEYLQNKQYFADLFNGCFFHGRPVICASELTEASEGYVVDQDNTITSEKTLAAVKEKVGDMPLVLHGGTGIPADMIKKAISLGVAKINVNTECQLAFQAATREYIEAGKDLQGKGFDPRKLLAPGFEAIKATVKEKMELFGSIGKA